MLEAQPKQRKAGGRVSFQASMRRIALDLFIASSHKIISFEKYYKILSVVSRPARTNESQQNKSLKAKVYVKAR